LALHLSVGDDPFLALKPTPPRWISRAPALLVMMMTALRKDTLWPKES
jgi:hypothetical protein